MAAARLRVAELVAHGETPPPRFVARFLAGEELFEWNWPVLSPNPTRRPEIGDAAFGRDPRPGERHDRARHLDHLLEACHGAIEIGNEHPFGPHDLGLRSSWPT